MENYIILASLFVPLFFLANRSTFAAHIVGGALSYEYIGNSKDIPHHYFVKLTRLQTARYNVFTNVRNGGHCTNSSCFPAQFELLSIVTDPFERNAINTFN